MQEVQLARTNNGESFELRRDDVIVIRLAENPTTGYCWEIEHFDSNILALHSSDFLLPEDPLIGEGGVRVFAFKAKTRGSTRIQLKHWRKWEGNDSITETFDVTAIVRK